MPEGLIQKIAARTTPPKPWKGTERGQRPGSASTPRQPSARLPPFAASAGAGLPSRLWVCGTTHEGDKVYVFQLWGHQAHCSPCRSCFPSTALTQCGRPAGVAGAGGQGSVWWCLSVTEQAGCCRLSQLPSYLDTGWGDGEIRNSGEKGPRVILGPGGAQSLQLTNTGLPPFLPPLPVCTQESTRQRVGRGAGGLRGVSLLPPGVHPYLSGGSPWEAAGC